MSYIRTSIFDRDSTISVELDQLDEIQDIIHSGWLVKRGRLDSGLHTWKARYFVLSSDFLFYFRDEISNKPLGKIHTKNLSVTNIAQNESDTFAFVTFEKTMYVKTIDQKDKNDWFEAIKTLQSEISRNEAKKSVEAIELKRRESLETIGPPKPVETEKVSVNQPNPVEPERQSVSISVPKKSGSSARDLSEMNTVNAILDDEMGTAHFRRYLETEYSHWQLDFWLDVRRFIDAVQVQEKIGFPTEGREELLKLSIKICNNYVHEGMETTVNIGKTLRDPLLKWNEMSQKFLENNEIVEWTAEYMSMILDNVTKIFQRAKHDVFKMLRGSYRRFKKSHLFDELSNAITQEEGEEDIVVSRGSCLKEDCDCKIYVQEAEKTHTSCASCKHFYEEHRNLSEPVENSSSKDSGGKPKVTMEQRKKLKLLLGKSVSDFENEEQKSSRREFLFDNMTALLYHPTDPLEVSDRRFKLKKYKNCFLGSEMVNRLEKRLKISRSETLGVVSEMMSHNIFYSVDKSRTEFIDGKFYYKFYKDKYDEIIQRGKLLDFKEETSESNKKRKTDDKKVKAEKSKSTRTKTERQEEEISKTAKTKEAEPSKKSDSRKNAGGSRRKAKSPDRSEESENSSDIEEAEMNLFDMLANSNKEYNRRQPFTNIINKPKTVTKPPEVKEPVKKTAAKKEDQLKESEKKIQNSGAEKEKAVEEKKLPEQVEEGKFVGAEKDHEEKSQTSVETDSEVAKDHSKKHRKHRKKKKRRRKKKQKDSETENE